MRNAIRESLTRRTKIPDRQFFSKSTLIKKILCYRRVLVLNGHTRRGNLEGCSAPRARGPDQWGRARRQQAAPALARRRQVASTPRRVATRSLAAPTICEPTPRGQALSAPMARAGNAAVRGIGQGHVPPVPSVRRVAGLGGQVPGSAVACAAAPHRCQPRSDPTRPVAGTRLLAAAIPRSHRSKAPRRAINDEVEPALDIWCNAWRGGSRQPLLGDSSTATASCATQTHALSSMGARLASSPLGTGGTVISQLVDQGSAAWLAMSATMGRCPGSWQAKASPKSD